MRSIRKSASQWIPTASYENTPSWQMGTRSAKGWLTVQTPAAGAPWRLGLIPGVRVQKAALLVWLILFPGRISAAFTLVGAESKP